jgi:uncharacterized membrane protein SpoIIM required for sporulation
MKVAQLLDARRKNWQQLEHLCMQMESRNRKSMGSAALARFAALYRAACADLALADSYQLPPGTVQYLHRLVGRAHNQLYRSRIFHFEAWGKTLLVEVPQRIFQDRCVQLCFVLFWGVFILSAVLAASPHVWPSYADDMIGREMISSLEENFSQPIAGRDPQQNYVMASVYIQHNTGIGLQSFAGGLLIVPGLFIMIYNSAVLGGCFGYMARPDVPQGENFFHFVTAHGPFELTAIVLSAGAGLRLGVSILFTNGLTRGASLAKTGRETMPVMGAAMVMFFLAAMIEGFLSPSAAPYWVKAGVALLSCGALMFYFVMLGYPRGGHMLALPPEGPAPAGEPS